MTVCSWAFCQSLYGKHPCGRTRGHSCWVDLSLERAPHNGGASPPREGLPTVAELQGAGLSPQPTPPKEASKKTNALRRGWISSAPLSHSAENQFKSKSWTLSCVSNHWNSS